MSKNRNIECNNCHKVIESDYKYCPICGSDLSLAKINATLNKDVLTESDSSKKAIVTKFSVSQIIFKVLGVSLLILDFILLIWFCWSAYVGSFVKFNKPIPKYVFSIDSEFFNTAGTDQMYNIFLIVLIIFGLIKVGFWLLKIKKLS